MIFWLLFSLILTVLYILIQLIYIKEWNKTPKFSPSATNHNTTVAIIIPARNEAKNIINLLHAITQQSYNTSLLEIIVIDDDSEDNTYQLVETFKKQMLNFNIKLFQLSVLCNNEKITAHKKTAIEKAIQLTQAELIVTTDADIIPSKNWINTIVQFYIEKKVHAIAAPVILSNEKNLIQQFQALDFCGMQLITAASLQAKMFNMANGANFTYTKKSFEAVNGFEDINHTASGDDMLLIYKIASKFNGKVAYLKSLDAAVFTSVQPTLSEFLQQRFRWTSKSNAYQDKRITYILIAAFLFSVSIVVNHCIAIISFIKLISISNNQNINSLFIFYNLLFIVTLCFFQLFFKTLVDYVLLRKATQFFQKQNLMRHFLIMEYLHIIYVFFVGFLGNILPYNWKGRKLK